MVVLLYVLLMVVLLYLVLRVVLLLCLGFRAEGVGCRARSHLTSFSLPAALLTWRAETGLAAGCHPMACSHRRHGVGR